MLRLQSRHVVWSRLHQTGCKGGTYTRDWYSNARSLDSEGDESASDQRVRISYTGQQGQGRAAIIAVRDGLLGVFPWVGLGSGRSGDEATSRGAGMGRHVMGRRDGRADTGPCRQRPRCGWTVPVAGLDYLLNDSVSGSHLLCSCKLETDIAPSTWGAVQE